MGLIQRGVIFITGTIANSILFLFLTRVLLPLLAEGREIAGTGPATPALQMLPTVFQLTIGAFQLGLIAYFVLGIGQERSQTTAPIQ